MTLKYFAVISSLLILAVTPAVAAEGGEEIPHQHWHFDGPFGKYDQSALQRGYLVYRQVCSACHSMNKLSYRHLTGLGYSEDQVKAIAAEYMITDGPNDEGDMFERPGRPSDRMSSPFANKQQAKAANGGAYPPDMSLLSYSRHGGADYIYALLTGYEETPAEFIEEKGELLSTQYYNKYMAGHVIAMAPPLSDGLISYPCNASAEGDEHAERGHSNVPACVPETAEQYARDVAEFLTWASDPKMELRKQIGLRAFIFLLILTGVFYIAKRKLWSKVH